MRLRDMKWERRDVIIGVLNKTTLFSIFFIFFSNFKNKKMRDVKFFYYSDIELVFCKTSPMMSFMVIKFNHQVLETFKKNW